ncbi:MAG: hypothetical protein J0I47_15550 [Sphingomonas sp.]|uniref:hypothetical protein n=1 Tax=Sphingomonas sp. TaxID=28214 RepID=UPI001AC8F5CA|nr:hypothetical protein [Sphingomonas sp.]MBN8809633.1 hypothetical protein [Sphingomonas sp.]
MRQAAKMVVIGLNAASLAMSGSGVAQTANETHRFEPPAGVQATGRVGRPIWTDERAIVVEGARIMQAVRKRVLIDVYSVAAYDPMTRVKSKAAFKACSVTNNVCLLDDDGDCTFDRVAKDVSGRGYDLDTKVRYQKMQVVEPGSSIERSIDLVSMSGGRMVFRYREETEDNGTVADETYTAPAYTRVLQIRDVALTIISVTPGSIEFKAASALASAATSLPSACNR